MPDSAISSACAVLPHDCPDTCALGGDGRRTVLPSNLWAIKVIPSLAGGCAPRLPITWSAYTTLIVCFTRCGARDRKAREISNRLAGTRRWTTLPGACARSSSNRVPGRSCPTAILARRTDPVQWAQRRFFARLGATGWKRAIWRRCQRRGLMASQRHWRRHASEQIAHSVSSSSGAPIRRHQSAPVGSFIREARRTARVGGHRSLKTALRWKQTCTSGHAGTDAALALG